MNFKKTDFLKTIKISLISESIKYKNILNAPKKGLKSGSTKKIELYLTFIKRMPILMTKVNLFK